MFKRLRSIASLVVLVFFAGSAFGQDDADITSLKAETGFTAWPPAPGAPLKKGLNFQPGDYPDVLPGFAVESRKIVIDYRDFGILGRLELVRGSERISVSIGVAFGSTDNGHELFLRSELALRQIAFSSSLKRGDPVIAVGDLNFVPQSATVSDVKGYIAFLRNNVICILRDGRPSAQSSVDLKNLAALIDARIQGMPNLTPSQFDSLRPTISDFLPMTSTLQAQEGSSTTLKVVISDPSGEPITRQFLSDGNFTIRDTGANVVARPSDALGTLPIELVAINASLQFSTKTTTITVTP